jgi:hypothetical protein
MGELVAWSGRVQRVRVLYPIERQWRYRAVSSAKKPSLRSETVQHDSAVWRMLLRNAQGKRRSCALRPLPCSGTCVATGSHIGSTPTASLVPASSAPNASPASSTFTVQPPLFDATQASAPTSPAPAEPVLAPRNRESHKMISFVDASITARP